ncbi:MAG: hypothetical protein U5L11_08230 [Arhodomonas sp.]|nr:hypothetical protein [Arhodomonas sp.]
MKSATSMLLGGALALLSLPALAAGTATMRMQEGPQGGPGNMSLLWNDQGNVRMNIDGEPGYLVVRDGKAYAVRNEGGQTLVLDLSAMQQAMGAATGGKGPGGPEVEGLSGDTELLSLDATGEARTVAGIDGEVYRMEWLENGDQRDAEVVLSDDPRALELTRAFDVMAGSMGVGADQDPDGVMQGLEDRGLGLLRMEGQFEVVSVSSGAPDDGTFELPAEPTDLMQMMQQMQQQ